MSMITTDMNVPKCCRDCDYECENEIFVYDIILKPEYIHKRHEDCPLKSIEGLLKQITQLHTQENEEGQDMYQAYDVLRTIREYCEVSE